MCRRAGLSSTNGTSTQNPRAAPRVRRDVASSWLPFKHDSERAGFPAPVSPRARPRPGRRPGRHRVNQPAAGSLHHVELWVPDLGRAIQEWGWLLGRLGYEPFQDWPDGRSWRLGDTYLVVEQSPALTAAEHDRLRPGLNHLAFHAGPRQRVDELAADGPAHGWTLLFPD